MYQSNRLYPQTLRNINSATFTGSYQAVGTALTAPGRIVKIVNNSTVPVTVSWDGVDDHDYLPSGTFCLYDCGTNRGTPSEVLDISERTQFFVKGAAGTGSVYLVVLSATTAFQHIPA